MPNSDFIPYYKYVQYPETEMKKRATEFRELMQRRRTVREYSDKKIPMEVIEEAILSAGTAPNGANMQPWHFAVVTDQKLKSQIRIAAEKEEQEFYNNRAPDDWLEALEPFGTDENKPFLEKAPCLIAIFSQSYGITDSGEKRKHYYVKESVGIATGMLITALHNAGLATLTHTPSPMGFLNELLGRPEYERPFLLLVTGYPAEGVTVPEISKKELNEIASFL